MPSDDGLRLNDNERGSPASPEARQQDPEPAVCLRKSDAPWSGALQHFKLVSQGQNFELDRQTRIRQCSEGQEQRAHHRDHGREAYASPAATSTAATRRVTLVPTATMDHYTRRIVGFGVHAGAVDGVGLCRMFNRAARGDTLPK